jgi:hypothetical protein
VTSSTEIPQSNGLAEKHIQTVKMTTLKMFQDGKTLWEVLATIQSTPVSDPLPSSSVLLQGRHLRGSLPFLPAALTPRRVSSTFFQQQLRRRQAEASSHQTRRVDVHSSALVVWARIGSRWLPDVVEAVCVEPHSYMVRLVDGRRFRHTRWAINLDYSSSSLSAPSPGLQFPFLSVGVLPNRNDFPVGPTHSGPGPASSSTAARYSGSSFVRRCSPFASHC